MEGKDYPLLADAGGSGGFHLGVSRLRNLWTTPDAERAGLDGWMDLTRASAVLMLMTMISPAV